MSEGLVFAVPLTTGGFATGVAARVNPRGKFLGYFFGPARAVPAQMTDADGLNASDAVLVGLCGDLGVLEGTWPLIGSLPSWDRDGWPMPTFVHREAITDRYVTVDYDDHLATTGSRTRLPVGEVASGPQDGLMGAHYAEQRLTRLLAPGQRIDHE